MYQHRVPRLLWILAPLILVGVGGSTGCDDKKKPPTPSPKKKDAAADAAAQAPAWIPPAIPAGPTAMPIPTSSPSAQPVIGRVNANSQAASVSQSSPGTQGTVANVPSVAPICVKYAEPYNPWPDVISQDADELMPPEKPRSFGQHCRKWWKKGKFKCHAGKNKSRTENEGEATTSPRSTDSTDSTDSTNISTTTRATTAANDAPKIIRTMSPTAGSSQPTSPKLALQGGVASDRSQEIAELNRTISELLQSRGNGTTLPFDPTFGTGAPGTGVYTYRPASNATNCIEWYVPSAGAVTAATPGAAANSAPVSPIINVTPVRGPVK